MVPPPERGRSGGGLSQRFQALESELDLAMDRRDNALEILVNVLHAEAKDVEAKLVHAVIAD